MTPSTLPLSLMTPAIAAGRAVGVLPIAEHHPAIPLQPIQRFLVGEEFALSIAHGHDSFAAIAESGGEAGLQIGDLQVDRLADIFQGRVAQQGAGQHAGFAQDLETVADAHHRDAALGGDPDRLDHGRERRHGPAAQIVAIGEAARQHDQVQARRQLGVLVPDHRDLGAGGALDRHLAVAVAVGAGEDDDGSLQDAISTR